MADHTAPDYYKQVVQEASEKLAQDDAKIEACVNEVVDRQLQAMREELIYQFGWATVRHANMESIKDLLYDIAFSAAREAKGVMIDSHYQESRKSTGAVIEAVFAGMELERENAS